jgi:GT2 family glycosyltransferase
MTPAASIIVVNWNGELFLPRCLDSLFAQTFDSFELIVVDNGSNDASVELLTRRYGDKIILVQNKTNLGFAGGNNCGIRLARGEFVVTINTDAYADKGWLGELISASRSDELIGMCGSKILLAEKPGLIDSMGVDIYPDGMSRQRRHLEKNLEGIFEPVEEILVPSACAALYRRKMLDEIGIFDEDFFAYCEDTDLGMRGRLAGWKAVVAPSAIVYHHYSGTAGRYSPLKARLVERNHFWVAVKIMPLSMIALVPAFTVIRLAAQCWDAITFSGKPGEKSAIKIDKIGMLWAVLVAYGTMLCGIPETVRKRKVVWMKARLSNRDVRNLFKRFRLPLAKLRLDPL